ncbi:uncharacterized protein SCHCODRAFT_02519701, partial [Schizophyllum commune H4-8]|uniref:uncharacterized protein n=1 Tax=Schizophyllum commune (strain H4-8 / FGSC 9210) TaxID=578458 RepID=UPI002160BC64
MDVESSTSKLVDEEGHAFRVNVVPEYSKRVPRALKYRRVRQQRRLRQKQLQGDVSAKQDIIIPPETCRKVPVDVHFSRHLDSVYVESKLLSHGNIDEVFGAPDTLLYKDNPFLQVSNFSSKPVTIAHGEVLGTCRNPRNWLDSSSKMSAGARAKIEAHSSFLRHLDATSCLPPPADVHAIRSESNISSKAQRNATEPDDPAATDPVEGGPKTSLPPEDFVDSARLLDELDISPDVNSDQRARIEQTIVKHKTAFGLDGRLGNYPAHVEIKLKPGTQPISLPPFPVSPAKREVI